MKRMKIWTAVILLCGLAVSGCKKDNTMAPGSAVAMSKTTTAQDKWPCAPVSIEMASERLVTDGNLRWKEGYLTATALFFEGALPAGNNTTTTEKYAADIQSTIKLFTPVILGRVNVPRNTYTSGSIQVQLNSYADNAALFMRGTYFLNGENIPLELTVNEPALISTEGLTNVMISNTSSYKATVYLNPGELTTGIDMTMMSGAVRTNGIITINSITNKDIYRIMVNNLQTHQLRVALSVSAPGTASSTLAPPDM